MLIKARNLLSQSTESMADLPAKHILVFDDGIEIESTAKYTMFSSYFWDIHRFYTLTPLYLRHHISYVLKGKPLTSNTHMDLLSIILDDVATSNGLVLPQQKEHLLGMIYEVTNRIHNEVAKLAESHVTSIDILDFIGIVEHPVIKELNANTLPTHESIARTYDQVLKVINTDPSLSNNAVAKAVRSKMVNANQILQCVSVRGFPTEVDGAILKTPILSNYTRGMRSLYDFAAESRSAAKSMYYSEAPLQDVEYFARRLQLLTMTSENVVYEDCGSTKYMEWRIAPPIIDEKGNVIYKGDQPFMIGKYYLDEATNTLMEITRDDPALYNKLLKIRTALYCTHKDPHKVCAVCFGALSKNLSHYVNLGHLCSATMTKQTSQSVLSIKHLAASGVSANIELGEQDRKYFSITKSKNGYLVKAAYKTAEPKLIVNRDEAIGLTDIIKINDINDVNPMRISSISYVDFSCTVNGVVNGTTLSAYQENRHSVLTLDFLRYLKDKGWTTDSKNNFVFDLSDWNFSLPVLVLPDMEYSYLDHSHQIAKMIESSLKNITDRSIPSSPVSTLQELFTLVNTKLEVNIVALEVIMYSTMVPELDKYAMARNVENPVLGVADQVIKNRSLSTALAYEEVSGTITNPRSFFKLDRPDSPFDAFISPGSVPRGMVQN